MTATSLTIGARFIYESVASSHVVCPLEIRWNDDAKTPGVDEMVVRSKIITVKA